MKDIDVISAGLAVMDEVVSYIDPSVFSLDSVCPNSITFSTGGDALNVAVNLSKLNASVIMSASLGKDAPGEMILNALEERGICTECVEIRNDVSTSVCIALCEKCGERHFVYSAGANDKFDAKLITDEHLKRAKILYIGSCVTLPSLDGEPLASLFKRAKEFGVITIMDASGTRDGKWMEKIIDALPYTDVFFPSEWEARELTGETDPVKMVECFLKNGAGAAGVKLGEKGCYVSDGTVSEFVPAIPCDNIADLIGAGDAFMSGFVKATLLGWPLLRRIRMGNVVANACIQSTGSATFKIDCDKAIARAESLQ